MEILAKPINDGRIEAYNVMTQMTLLAKRYEKIISAMIMNVNIEKCAGKGVFVYDMNQKYKDNVRAFQDYTMKNEDRKIV